MPIATLKSANVTPFTHQPRPAEARELSGSRPRTVLVVRSDLLPYSETFIKEQVLAYRRWRPVLVGVRRAEGVPTDDLNVRMLPRSNSLPARIVRKTLATLEITPPAVRRLVREEQPSLIHVHFGTDAAENWSWINTLDLPVLITLHGYDINIHKSWWRAPGNVRGEQKYPDTLLRIGADPRVHFVAVSDSIRARAIEWGLPSERISRRHIGVNLNMFHKAGLPVEHRAPRILFVGRMVEKKGGEYLIRAFARVRTQIPAAELVMVGSGRRQPKLASLAAELNVPVSFAGVLSSEQIKELLHTSRVFCLPSITAENGDAEGLGIVLLEAQACGVPVVTSARGGANEGILHGSTGFAFAEKDVDQLTEYLLRVLQDDALAASMSVAARRNIEQSFALSNCTAKLEELYDAWVTKIPRHAGVLA